MRLSIKHQQGSFYRSLSKLLVAILIINLVSPALHAQDLRGLFLQGGLSIPNTSGNLRGGVEEDSNVSDQNDLDGANLFQGKEDAVRAMIYQVHVLGEVKRPGTYRVSPSMRVTDALQMAGNLKPNGSERFIELRQGVHEKARVLDLFAYKVLGQLSQNPYLQDNDTIFVPLRNMAVEIQGPVHRPGLFELKNEKHLNDIVDLAGGFTVGVSQKEPIRVIRYGGYEDKQVLEIAVGSEEMRSFKVQDGDVIVIPHKFLTQHQFDYNLKKLPNDNIYYPSQEKRIFVIGAVRSPGAFEFNPYYALRQYLTLAGGTTTMAKNGKIKVVSFDGKSMKAKDGEYKGVMNPGDTIVVPEKSIPVSFYIGLLPTIASLGLSAAALFK